MKRKTLHGSIHHPQFDASVEGVEVYMDTLFVCQTLPTKKVQSIWQFLKALRHEARKTKGDQKPL